MLSFPCNLKKLRAAMQNFDMLSVIILTAIMRSVIILSVVMASVFMLSVIHYKLYNINKC
jgi:hypothetical protein